jgi:hypothetical protein
LVSQSPEILKYIQSNAEKVCLSVGLGRSIPALLLL